MPREPTGRGRGRPRSITGNLTCDRCGATARIRVIWPDGRICGVCFHRATRTVGDCDACGRRRLLPGRNGDRRLCRDCAGITTALECARCGREGERYRRGICARCALRDDLTDLMLPVAGCPPSGVDRIVEALCSAGRPESVITWKRNPTVQRALADLGSGAITLDHDSLDRARLGREGEHLRAFLIHLGLLPPRDPDLARLEQWLDNRLTSISDPTIRRPLEKFAAWHHLERVRHRVRGNQPAAGAALAIKQEITAANGFLDWLRTTKGRTIADCTQVDIDQWLSEGTAGRWAIRTFIVWATRNQVSPPLTVNHRPARSTRLLTHDDRNRLLRTCLTETPDTLAYRVAAVLLLLYAQPLVRIARLTTTQVFPSPTVTFIRFGGTSTDKTFVPEPFAALLRQHLTARPNTQTVNTTGNPWLFPGQRAGRHLTADVVARRLRHIGINLLGARNRSLRELVRQVPAPIVAAQLGFSPKVALRHAALAAEPDQRYAALVRRTDHSGT
jgi:integrase